MDPGLVLPLDCDLFVFRSDLLFNDQVRARGHGACARRFHLGYCLMTRPKCTFKTDCDIESILTTENLFIELYSLCSNCSDVELDGMAEWVLV